MNGTKFDPLMVKEFQNTDRQRILQDIEQLLLDDMGEEDYAKLCWLYVYDHAECWRMLGERLSRGAGYFQNLWLDYLDREREEAAAA